MSDPAPRETVAQVARLLVANGLVEAFGHVSARAPARAYLTPTSPLTDLQPEHVLELPLDDPPEPEVPPVPIEAPLHRAIYRRRPDVNAICRHHGPASVAWGVRGEPPPLLHGLGGLAGAVGVLRDPQLVDSPSRGEAAADALGSGASLLLMRNGALSVGATLAEAYARAHFLEQRCRVALVAPSVPLAGLSLDERSTHFDAELRRATIWAEHQIASTQMKAT